MKKLSLAIVAAAVLAGCGSGISGDYGGENCFFEKLSFQGDGVVYVTFLGAESPGEYKVDGDKVVITVNGQGTVFTKNGDTLEAGVLGEKMQCTKLE